MEILKRECVENIRSQYEPKSEQLTKLEQLQKLDRKVRRPASVFAYVFGAAGALVLGTGMCLAMKIIANMMVLGIVVGVIGIAMVSANYFIYKAILAHRKKKYAQSVLQLSDELLNQ